MVKNCSQMITYYQCTFAKQATFYVDHVRIFNRAKFLLPCLVKESVQIPGSDERSPTLDKVPNKISFNQFLLHMYTNIKYERVNNE